MKRYMWFILAIMVLSGAAFVMAQETVNRDVIIERSGPPDSMLPEPPEPPDAPLPPDTFMFLSSDFEESADTVAAAPYSADAVTERTQYLSDGNRIYQKNTAKLFRDSKGRTRREQTMGHLGFWASAEGTHSMIFIHDPIAKLRYILHPDDQTAEKISVSDSGQPFVFHRKIITETQDGKTPAPPSGSDQTESSAPAPPVEKRVFVHRVPPPGGHGPHEVRIPSVFGEPKKESLGEKVIEGIKTEGTRTITTIDAGKIGNDRPIEIISEKWYSPELKVNVLTKHTDPRWGETVYRLTNVKRAEPDASLFKVPDTYKVESN